MFVEENDGEIVGISFDQIGKVAWRMREHLKR